MGYAQNDPEGQARLAALLEALKPLGWEGGRNLQIELRWASADVAQISRFAKELVAFKPDLIVSNTTPVTAAIHRETADIPIVFIVVSDPVGEGFVASLSHPGRNITGFIDVEDTIGGKWLELLKEVAPTTNHAAMMFNPDTAPGGGNYFLPNFRGGWSRTRYQDCRRSCTQRDRNRERHWQTSGERNGGLVVMTDGYMTVHRRDIIRLAERERLPTVYPTSISAHDGGLISYAPDYHDVFRRGASYVDRVLRGESASDTLSGPGANKIKICEKYRKPRDARASECQTSCRALSRRGEREVAARDQRRVPLSLESAERECSGNEKKKEKKKKKKNVN